MANKSYREVLNWASSFLNEHKKEAYIAEYLLLERLGWDKTQWLMAMNEPIPESVEKQLYQDLESIMKDYPPQYVIGSVLFYESRFKVTEDTLIPRPETEELVALCLQKNSTSSLKVLDIGTGTGAIAISLKKARPQWQVSATDVSPQALAIAKENAENLSTEVIFYEGDLFQPVEKELFDIIISNPPYISVDEWEEMDESVRLFEPKIALFAEAEGMAIYQRLARETPQYLTSKGQIFLEIGYRQGKAVQQLFQEAFPRKKVDIMPDLQGKDRMIWVHEN